MIFISMALLNVKYNIVTDVSKQNQGVKNKF